MTTLLEAPDLKMSQVCIDSFFPLLHQVAGCRKGSPTNILINQSGQIFKPHKVASTPTHDLDEADAIANDLIPVASDEFQFYIQLNQSSDVDCETLKILAPTYFGAISIKDVDHLVLEDFTQGMKYPCVMDVKIGRERYYPGRVKEKSIQDKIKYPCLREFGFCLSGIKLWNPETGEVEKHLMSKVTRQFSSEEVRKYMQMFLRVNDKGQGVTLSRYIIEKAEAIGRWSANQRSFILRGSSVLFVYDAAGCSLMKREPFCDLKARVGMIDFAHTFHSFGAMDENYFNGIKNLIEFIRSCSE